MAKVLPAPIVTGEFADATPYREDAASLRSLLRETGYLFFRGLLPARNLLEVRREILERCGAAGWLEPGIDPLVGRVRKGVGPFAESLHPEYDRLYDDLQRLESFHALPHHPNLLNLLQDLFGEEVLLHPRHIARLIFPMYEQETTPPHQDYVHIKGTKETLTIWIPLGDCPSELGGLAILSGSHRLGLLPTVETHGAGRTGVEIGESEREWVSSEFELGDVVMFNSHTVHAGLANKTENLLRLSIDVRAQPASRPVHAWSLLPHMGRVTWDAIYSDWKSDRFKRYWEKLNLDLERGGGSNY
jgi:hypothetical protein